MDFTTGDSLKMKKNLLLIFLFCKALVAGLPVVPLPDIDFSRANIAGVSVGVRPIGKGINLDIKEIEGKTVCFNTGHGGFGACIAPACAGEIVRRFELSNPNCDRAQPLAVIGAGFSGLFTAKALLAAGYTNVTIYANQFPVAGDFLYAPGKTPPITSMVAGGYFYPFMVSMPDQSLYEKLVVGSWEWWLANQTQLPGISMRNVFSVTHENPAMANSLVEKLMGASSRKVSVTIDGHQHTPAWEYKTLFIDGKTMLPWLLDDLRAKGVRFVKTTISGLGQLSENVLFNCSGLGSAKLFGELLIPSRGQLIHFKMPNGQFPYFLRGIVGGRAVNFYPTPNGVALGLTAEVGEDGVVPNVSLLERSLSDAHAFMAMLLGAPNGIVAQPRTRRSRL